MEEIKFGQDWVEVEVHNLKLHPITEQEIAITNNFDYGEVQI